MQPKGFAIVDSSIFTRVRVLLQIRTSCSIVAKPTVQITGNLVNNHIVNCAIEHSTHSEDTGPHGSPSIDGIRSNSASRSKLMRRFAGLDIGRLIAAASQPRDWLAAHPSFPSPL